MEQLAKLSLPKLGELWLKSDAITDNSVEYLAKLKGLRYIFWLKSGTRMSKEGIAELQKALPECEIN